MNNSKYFFLVSAFMVFMPLSMNGMESIGCGIKKVASFLDYHSAKVCVGTLLLVAVTTYYEESDSEGEFSDRSLKAESTFVNLCAEALAKEQTTQPSPTAMAGGSADKQVDDMTKYLKKMSGKELHILTDEIVDKEDDDDEDYNVEPTYIALFMDILNQG